MEANILSLLQASDPKEQKGQKNRQVKHQVEYAKRQFPLSKVPAKRAKKTKVLSDARKSELLDDSAFLKNLGEIELLLRSSSQQFTEAQLIKVVRALLKH